MTAWPANDLDPESYGVKLSGPGCICRAYTYGGHVEPGSVNPECPSCYPEGPDMQWLAFHAQGRVVIRKRGGRWLTEVVGRDGGRVPRDHRTWKAAVAWATTYFHVRGILTPTQPGGTTPP